MNVSRKRYRAPSMASKKRYKSQSKRKLTVRSPVAKIWKPVSQKSGQGNSIDVTFIYTSKFSLNAAVLGGANAYQFSLTSLFDPDITGVGTQPIPTDQYAALYETYRVYETSFKVCMFSGDSSNAQIAGYIVNDSTTTTVDLERYIQNGQCEWAPMGRIGSSTDTVTLWGTCDIAKAHGISRKRLLSDDIYSAPFTAGPNEQQILTLFVASSGNADAAAGECYIEIRYKARLEGNILVVTS